jgi:hypothetical protein
LDLLIVLTVRYFEYLLFNHIVKILPATYCEKTFISA